MSPALQLHGGAPGVAYAYFSLIRKGDIQVTYAQAYNGVKRQRMLELQQDFNTSLA